MNVTIKPSDLQFRYPRKKETRHLPKFRGGADPHPFDRDDQYEVIPMLEAVMSALGTNDGRVLNRLEEVLNTQVPSFLRSRGEVFEALVGMMREELRD